MADFVDTLPESLTPAARAAENRAFATELRANPGKYAKYEHDVDHPVACAHRIRAGKTSAFGRGFDAKVRDGIVFVAYVGVDA